MEPPNPSWWERLLNYFFGRPHYLDDAKKLIEILREELDRTIDRVGRCEERHDERDKADTERDKELVELRMRVETLSQLHPDNGDTIKGRS